MMNIHLDVSCEALPDTDPLTTLVHQWVLRLPGQETQTALETLQQVAATCCEMPKVSLKARSTARQRRCMRPSASHVKLADVYNVKLPNKGLQKRSAAWRAQLDTCKTARKSCNKPALGLQDVTAEIRGDILQAVGTTVGKTIIEGIYDGVDKIKQSATQRKVASKVVSSSDAGGNLATSCLIPTLQTHIEHSVATQETSIPDSHILSCQKGPDDMATTASGAQRASTTVPMTLDITTVTEKLAETSITTTSPDASDTAHDAAVPMSCGDGITAPSAKVEEKQADPIPQPEQIDTELQQKLAHILSSTSMKATLSDGRPDAMSRLRYTLAKLYRYAGPLDGWTGDAWYHEAKAQRQAGGDNAKGDNDKDDKKTSKTAKYKFTHPDHKPCRTIAEVARALGLALCTKPSTTTAKPPSSFQAPHYLHRGPVGTVAIGHSAAAGNTVSNATSSGPSQKLLPPGAGVVGHGKKTGPGATEVKLSRLLMKADLAAGITPRAVARAEQAAMARFGTQVLGLQHRAVTCAVHAAAAIAQHGRGNTNSPSEDLISEGLLIYQSNAPKTAAAAQASSSLRVESCAALSRLATASRIQYRQVKASSDPAQAVLVQLSIQPVLAGEHEHVRVHFKVAPPDSVQQGGKVDKRTAQQQWLNTHRQITSTPSWVHDAWSGGVPSDAAALGLAFPVLPTRSAVASRTWGTCMTKSHTAAGGGACTETDVQVKSSDCCHLSDMSSQHMQGVLQWHEAAKQEHQRRKEEARRKRLEALRSSDIEAYLSLVRETRSTRLQEVLSQTEECLTTFAKRLGLTHLMEPTEEEKHQGTSGSPSPKSPCAADCLSPSSGRGSGGGAGIAAASEVWSRLARRLRADIDSQPAMVTGGQLRDYQMHGLRWMVSLHDHGLSGILADDMGLGKTVQVITLMCHLIETGQPGPFLIAAPASVLSNWAAECARWAPGLKVVVYRGQPERREHIWDTQIQPFVPSFVAMDKKQQQQQAAAGSKKRGRASTDDEVGSDHDRDPAGVDGSGGFHVLLTTYDFLMAKNDRPKLTRIPWCHIIIDEGHRLKDSNCKLARELNMYKSRSRLLLTGTPLQNCLSELWSLLQFLLPGAFGPAEDFDKWFSAPLEALRLAGACDAGAGDAAAGAGLTEEEFMLATNRLHQVLRPFVLRRLVTSVATELPGKEERLITLPMTPYQRALNALVCQRFVDCASDSSAPGGGAAATAAAGGGGSKGLSISVQNTFMELRKIANHPLLSLMHPADEEDYLPGGLLDPHYEHGRRLSQVPPLISLSSKMEVLERLLTRLNQEGRKVLLFSTMTTALDLVEDMLSWKGWDDVFLRLDGNTSSDERGQLISRFNDKSPGSPWLFLLSVRAGGVGLNLQAADTIIMYDSDINPQMDLQAQARAYRIGQENKVLVLRLVVSGSIEDHILSVANEKRRFADSSITGGFFDGQTSEQDRRAFLLGLLQETAAKEDDKAAAGAADQTISDAQLDKILNRQKLITSGNATSGDARPLGPASSATMPPAGVSRLLSQDQIGPLVRAMHAHNTVKDPDTGKEFGRGMRSVNAFISQQSNTQRSRSPAPTLAGNVLPGNDSEGHPAAGVDDPGKPHTAAPANTQEVQNSLAGAHQTNTTSRDDTSATVADPVIAEPGALPADADQRPCSNVVSRQSKKRGRTPRAAPCVAEAHATGVTASTITAEAVLANKPSSQECAADGAVANAGIVPHVQGSQLGTEACHPDSLAGPVTGAAGEVPELACKPALPASAAMYTLKTSSDGRLHMPAAKPADLCSTQRDVQTDAPLHAALSAPSQVQLASDALTQQACGTTAHQDTAAYEAGNADSSHGNATLTTSDQVRDTATEGSNQPGIDTEEPACVNVVAAVPMKDRKRRRASRHHHPVPGRVTRGAASSANMTASELPVPVEEDVTDQDPQLIERMNRKRQRLMQITQKLPSDAHVKQPGTGSAAACSPQLGLHGDQPSTGTEQQSNQDSGAVMSSAVLLPMRDHDAVEHSNGAVQVGATNQQLQQQQQQKVGAARKPRGNSKQTAVVVAHGTPDCSADATCMRTAGKPVDVADLPSRQDHVQGAPQQEQHHDDDQQQEMITVVPVVKERKGKPPKHRPSGAATAATARVIDTSLAGAATTATASVQNVVHPEQSKDRSDARRTAQNGSHGDMLNAVDDMSGMDPTMIEKLNRKKRRLAVLTRKQGDDTDQGHDGQDSGTPVVTISRPPLATTTAAVLAAVAVGTEIHAVASDIQQQSPSKPAPPERTRKGRSMAPPRSTSNKESSIDVISLMQAAQDHELDPVMIERMNRKRRRMELVAIKQEVADSGAPLGILDRNRM